ncbi:hypothetical protein F4820DRAFT_465328 [Hypoxylon rubiginosum]|uniref:Uncharacterized protein n=1 Tax=Hypoxylon rubiginosum TaxID=110542 RepID=A0ACB9YNB5_9PEZI|nr:hypothetical protein F4820DRAFT_465328 [Hypoxylon rubiginosum]
MKLSLTFSLWAVVALGQFPECTRELAATDECAAVIDANACYNQFRFTNNQTLSCIDGTSNDDRAKKACMCCSCVGQVMCNWVTQSRFNC